MASGTLTIANCVIIDENIGDIVSLIEQEQVAVAGRVTAVEEELVIVKAGAEESRIADLEQEQDTLASAASALTDRVTSVEQGVAAVSSVPGEISALESAATAVSNRVDATEDDIVAQVSATAAISTRVGATEDDIAALEQKDTSLASTISDLSARVTTAENAIDAVNTSLALAIQRIDTLESQDLGSRVDSLEENDPIGVADRVYLVSNATNRMMYATTSTANANGVVTNEYTSWKMYKETSAAQAVVN
ncbi:unnamed protein product [Ectocarpus sp. 4 AP-2014]|uniref:EsV-1-216 n=1 Tax=Ectocarpus siliculosus virus 1 (isolate New Zealand/Kaikoura/1988) TaxID=654926 RepID=Q8QN74_ESV1K|nr:EsV-1-216 [Ectocarpus siliculosus virus 1]AAK14630.1 EsV-1-216 [Ectocarpus siliculosus virus 1]